MSAACEQYKNDNGDVPHSRKTDLLDPRVHGNPASGDDRKKYQDACLELYSALSGDCEPHDRPDFKPEPGRKMYYEFKPNNLRNLVTTGDPHSGKRPSGGSVGRVPLG
jgi:hypothetical protein